MTYPVLVEFSNITIRYEVVEDDLLFLHLEYDGEVDDQGYLELYDVFSEILVESNKFKIPCVFCLIREDKDRRIALVESLGFIEEEKVDGMILFKAETF